MSTTCPSLICTPPDDLLSYSLQGLTNRLRPVPPFSNAEVRWCCDAGLTLSFVGTLPDWITIANDCLVGAAGRFFGNNQAVATQIAQGALDSFAVAQQTAGNLICAQPTQCDPDAIPLLDADIPTGSTLMRGSCYASTVDRIFVGEGKGPGGGAGTRILIIDPSTNTVENTIVVPNSFAIEQLAYSTTSDTVYAAVTALAGHDFVLAINPSTLATTTIGPNADFDDIYGLTWDSARNQIYAGWTYSNFDIGIVPIDCATNTILAAREVTIGGWGPGNLVYYPPNDTVYMIMYAGGIYYIDPASMTVLGNIPIVGGTYQGCNSIACSVLAGVILAAHYGAFEVVVVDPASNTVSQYINTNPRLFYGSADTECRLEWASGLQVPGTIIEFRKPDLSSVGLLSVSGNPGDPSYCPTNKRVYVPGDSSVRVIGPT